MNEKRNLIDDFGELLLQRHDQNHQQYLQDGIVKRDDNEFGRFIRAARENVTLTRDDLAMMTTMTAATIAGIEYGTILVEDVEIEWVYELAESLNEELSTLNLILGREVGSMVLTEWVEEEYASVAQTPFYDRWWQAFSKQVAVVRERVVGWWQGDGGWMQSNWQPTLASGMAILFITFMFTRFYGMSARFYDIRLNAEYQPSRDSELNTSNSSSGSSNNSTDNSNSTSSDSNNLSNAERNALLSSLKTVVYIAGAGGGGDDNYGIPHITVSNKNPSLNETVFMTGKNFDPNKFYAVGIYYMTNPYLVEPLAQLASSTIVQTDERGQFSFAVGLDSKFRNGQYSIAVGEEIVPDQSDTGRGSLYPRGWFDIGYTIKNNPPNNSSSSSSNSPASITCSGAPSTRLNVGFRARIAYIDGTPGSVRTSPASSQILGKVPEGTSMDIVGGPRCNNSRIWWEVETNNGYAGWISEGKIGEYWLEPAN